MTQQQYDTNFEPQYNRDTTTFSIHDILQMILQNWYWFVISVGVCLVFAIFYLQTTPKIYHREATILVKDSRKGGDMDITAFNDLAGLSTRRNVDNEVYVLQSRRLMQNVVEKLNLTISYTTEGTLRTIDLYRRSPIEAIFVNNIKQQALGFTATILPDSTVSLTDFKMRDIEDELSEQVIEAKYGEVVNTPIGQLIINPTLYMNEEYIDRDIKVVKGSLNQVVAAYRKAVTCTVANKLASIVSISMNNNVPQRAEDVINSLIEAYNNDAIEEKRSVSTKTAEFIADRLEVVGRELGDVDKNIEEFKKSNQLVDLEAEASRSMTESTRYKGEALSLENQITISEYVKEYLLDQNNANSLIPTIVGIKDANINTQIGQYNTGVLRYEKLASDGAINNPQVSQLNRELAAVRQSIIAALESHISTLEMQLDTFRKEEDLANSRISSAPSQEKAILSITRQQRIKEELYLYLLNKREENELTYAITESNARIVDWAYGPVQPVAPKSMLIVLVALILGLAIPFLVFYMFEILDTSIRGRKDIEDNISVPFLGDIPLYDGPTQKGVVVRENGRDSVSEAFRFMRSNMMFMRSDKDKLQTIMMTSSNPHAGKTFVTLNTAMTLALTGKSVVVIDLDLRRRSLSKQLGLRNAQGASNFLTGAITNINDIINNSTLHEKFDIISAGPMPPNPAELLMSKNLDTMIEELEKRYDFVLIDNAPAMNVADAMICDRLCDLCVYVVREGLMDRRQLPDIERLYQEKKFHNMCIVLNGANLAKRKFGYGYGYGYGYQYGLSGKNKENASIGYKLKKFFSR